MQQHAKGQNIWHRAFCTWCYKQHTECDLGFGRTGLTVGGCSETRLQAHIVDCVCT